MPEPIQLHPSPLRPNWRLKAAREQLGWSQQKLAGRLGVTTNSVSRWERGISSPSLYFRRQLCDLLGKSAEELGLLPDRSAASSGQSAQSRLVLRSPAPPIWSVPFQRNPFFTGREEELIYLHQFLHSGKSHVAPFPLALCGLAGIGKTQTAVEYCYRFSQEYQAVLWVRADTTETLVADLVSIAALLELPERDEHDQQRVVEAVKGWLKAHRDWLLVLDNLEDLASIQQVVPSIHQGHILVTTRRQATGTVAQSVNLRKMDTQEGALFLLRRTKHLSPDAGISEADPAEYSSALEIAQVLDGLPLALDQAGAYIEETACPLADYLDLYQARRATLLHLRGGVTADHPASVAATFSLVIERVERLHPAAANLLSLCAFLHPDNIPEAMIVEGASADGSILESLARDPSSFDAAIKTLRDFSLIQRDPQSKTLSLHRLVQVVLQDRMDEPARRQWAQDTVALVSRAFPDSGDDVNWPRGQRYLSQALACAVLIEHFQMVIHEAGALLLKTGYHLTKSGQYAQAENLLLRARSILLLTVGERHADYADCLNDLALLYHYLGRYGQVESLYHQALQIYEQIFGSEHPFIAESLNNLASLYYTQGQYAQAEALFLQALQLQEKLSGPESPAITFPLHNLACLTMDRGKYAQAEPLLLRVVALREKVLGPEHPYTLSSLGYLGRLYAARKQYVQAEALHQRVLALREKHLGTRHAHIGTSLYYLAQMYHEIGQSSQAEALYCRALAIRESALGPEHPQTAQTLNDLAWLLLEQGQIERGGELCWRALTIREQKLGTRHPDYADSLATLALLHERRGDGQRAMQLNQEALAICEGKLMPEHPLIMRCQAAYNRLLAKEQARSSLAADSSPSPMLMPENPLADFLAACCEGHPRAWCRAADLWATYQLWTEEHGERFPFSRRAFALALKQQGYSPDRTNQYRIWRGIALRATDGKK
jgi:tetratricopeptide (TPR) repeat protein/transcriptional regulator with XRE-family HTH domain